MSEEEPLISSLYDNKHVIFTVSAEGDDPSFSIRSQARIKSRAPLSNQPPLPPVTVQAPEITATPEDINKAIFLTDEARKGRTLIVKVTDPEKFRSRLVPEELCVNMKEKRVRSDLSHVSPSSISIIPHNFISNESYLILLCTFFPS